MTDFNSLGSPSIISPAHPLLWVLYGVVKRSKMRAGGDESHHK